MSLHEQCREALLDARDRFNDMQEAEARTGMRQEGYEELRVAVRHLEELLGEFELDRMDR